MNFIELVKSRRSVREFTNRAIERSSLELCVEAARYAPSACNSQPWKFIIVDDPTRKNEISENIFSGIYDMNTFAREAAAFIVLISKKTIPL